MREVLTAISDHPWAFLGLVIALNFIASTLTFIIAALRYRKK